MYERLLPDPDDELVERATRAGVDPRYLVEIACTPGLHYCSDGVQDAFRVIRRDPDLIKYLEEYARNAPDVTAT
ncbi:hypothetical protein HZA45_00395 [Candidatus Peregrinibacteria bacterium]|nr:hypothetical protein [Candidatus Peregrinibacteria bacterium]